jgi:hypothetical protein
MFTMKPAEPYLHDGTNDENKDEDKKESDPQIMEYWRDLICTTSNFTKQFMEKYGHNFILTDGMVYVFWQNDDGNGRWHNNKRNWDGELTRYIVKYGNELKLQIENQRKAKLLTHSDTTSTIINSMCNHNNKFAKIKRHMISDNYLKPCLHVFDQNKLLLGYNNGVYDLSTFQFRKSTFDDYITMTTGFDYDENFDPETYENSNMILLLNNK